MGETVSSLMRTGSKSNGKGVSEDSSNQWHFEYSTIVGFFRQDNPRTDPGTFDAMKENFGLIEQDYDTDTLLPANGKDLTQWERFAFHLKTMNERAPKTVTYRLLYLGRHGNGYHNVASKFYGDNAWDCYYSTSNNDPHVPSFEWFDAHLTLLGKHQAHMAHQFWQRMITAQRVPVPQTYYSSPHTRAIQTAQLTFSSLDLPSSKPFDPLIKEFLREGHGIHTCDKRPTRSYLVEKFPEFRIEEGFTETDELYSPTYREPPRPHAARLVKLLDDIFEHDDSTYISMTSHNGTIGATLRAVGHRTFVLPTGGIIPVLVKVKKVTGPRPDDGSGDEPWETKPDCEGDPLKARRPGNEKYRDVREFLDEIERGVPKDWDEGLNKKAGGEIGRKATGNENGETVGS